MDSDTTSGACHFHPRDFNVTHPHAKLWNYMLSSDWKTTQETDSQHTNSISSCCRAFKHKKPPQKTETCEAFILRKKKQDSSLEAFQRSKETFKMSDFWAAPPPAGDPQEALPSPSTLTKEKEADKEKNKKNEYFPRSATMDSGKVFISVTHFTTASCFCTSCQTGSLAAGSSAPCCQWALSSSSSQRVQRVHGALTWGASTCATAAMMQLKWTLSVASFLTSDASNVVGRRSRVILKLPLALLLYFLVVVRYVHTLHNNRIFATNHLTVVHLLKNVVLPGTCFFFLFFFSILAFQFISVSLTSQRRVGRNALSHCLGVWCVIMSVEDVAVKNLRDQSLTGVICIQDSLY